MIAVLLTALSLATVHVGPCPALNDTWVEGCTIGTDQVWVKNDAPPWILHHELGHVMDYKRMTYHKRQQWRRILHRGKFNQELFAESFAACVASPYDLYVGPVSYNYEPTARQHRRICRLLRTLA